MLLEPEVDLSMRAGAEVVDGVAGFGELFYGILVGLVLVEEGIQVIFVEFDAGVGIASFDGPMTRVTGDRLFKVCHTGNSVGRNQRHLYSPSGDPYAFGRKALRVINCIWGFLSRTFCIVVIRLF